MSSPTSISYRMLGPLEVRDGPRLFDPGKPKQRAVLAALLVNANRVVSMDRLIDALWGADPPPAATGSLQAYIANLRRVLEPDRPPRAPAQMLVTRAPGYQLNVAPEDLDVATFERLAAHGRALLEQDRPDAAQHALAEALGLWRGRPLAELEGYDFADVEATRLTELHLSTRELYAEAALAAGRPHDAIENMERLCGEAPLRERAAELLGLALYRCGRQADGLAALARIRATLAAELGVDPSPALRALHAAILSHDPALTGPPPRRGAGPVRRPTPTPVSDDEPVRPALIGRAVPLARMRRALAAATAGRGGVLLVAGEPGIGKTRLVEELAAEAAAVADVAWGRCHDTTIAPAFWPWRQALGALAAARPAEVKKLTADMGLSVHGPDGAPELVTGPGEPSRFLRYEAAGRLVAGLAARQPVVLVCEDAHWADPGSLELLTHLAGQLHRARVLLVATFRDTEVGDELAKALARLAREPRCERIKLSALGPAEIASLAATAGWTGGPALAGALHERTGGNPFFATELGKLLAGDGRPAGPDAWPVPAGVQDVLRQRIARLPGQAVTVIEIASVAGPTFSVEVLEQVSGLEEDRVLFCLDAAVATGLLKEDAAVPGRYRFVHALVSDTVYRGLSGTRRSRLHARVGEAIRTRYGTRFPDALAHHFWQAGPAAPAEQALEHVLASADGAERSLAFERAVVLLERAVVLCDRVAPGPAAEKRALEVRMRLARLLVRITDHAAPRAGTSRGLHAVPSYPEAPARGEPALVPLIGGKPRIA
ncbi:MAG: AAA family ATPase, partial [Pseudonocardia sp.]|nr:AAA family ATPase [Pseudonocardia sp.]